MGAYAVVEGLHALAFYKSVKFLGAVPVAVSKGLQQAGGALVIHIGFCNVDPTQCLFNYHGDAIAWGKWQKAVAAGLSVVGVVVYALVKAREGGSRRGVHA